MTIQPQIIINAYDGKKVKKGKFPEFLKSVVCEKFNLSRPLKQGLSNLNFRSSEAIAIIKKSEFKQIEELINEQPNILLREKSYWDLELNLSI